ncbi:hypothetical protein PPL_09511 [Heterostelium album PN500]|uniref:Fibronectin type-III domain-containing protein n=1 Tax=Heterostelium pallidum (strain ATCC 26659 / Pp 5 / PN500) TaxID=670386 RepID=D3BNA0_HETP5|nr:hypothetical protein PPL_09511 [Heterostelium album PN500]EFA76760.1 hypothetical protein PPL_09511 [Heterostelium album PN500]|eukprot:XP_020428892.1 hypothetical protein PPL_09511 [Heterostelium album PN500]
MRVEYLNGNSYVATSCNSLTGGQSCTISGIPTGLRTNIKATLNGESPFGGANSGTSAYIQMPSADTMNSVTVTARTTKTITVSYKSNQGVNGVTSFVVKSNNVQVGGCSFTSCTITGLTPGQTVSIAVNAVNYGVSSAAMTTSGTTYTAVTTPSLSSTNTPNSIVATFSATGGVPSPATTYQVLLNGAVQSCTASPCTLSGLTTLATYTLQVKATNDGTTTQSGVLSIKLWDLMKTPTLSANMFTNRAVLSFSAAGGNPALTRYTIQSNGVDVANCKGIATTTCTVSSLTPGTSYKFVVTAVNAPTTLSSTVTQSTYSEITLPTLTATTITTKSMIVSFSTTQGVPSSTLYTIINNGVNVPGCVGISTTTCAINTLTQATGYNIQVDAVNDGKKQSTSKTFTTLAEVTTPTVTIKQSALTLTITYSTQNGYQTSVYDVVVNGATICAATTALQCTFNSVVLGTKYDVQVKVTNDGLTKIGTSSYQTYSDSIQKLQIVSYTTSSVTFSYSSTYGVQGVTTFAFTINGAAATCNDFAQCTVSGFTPSNPGVQLTIVGKSINYGNSSPTKTITQQLYPVVSVPTFTLTNTPVSITVTFSSINGVPSPATSYQVLLNSAVQTCTTSPCTLSGLTTLSTYSVQVKATNDGTTTLSTVQSVKLWDLMSTPTISANMFTNRAVLSFSATGGNPALTSYTIQSNGVDVANCKGIATTTCTVSSLTPGTSYRFTVIAVNSVTTLSNTVTQSTYPEITLPTLTATTITTKSMIVSFSTTQGVPSSTLYTVSNKGVNVPGCVGISTTTCTINTLTQATDYVIQVDAVNDGKKQSTSKTFTTLAEVTTPTVTIKQSALTLTITYSTQNGYQTSVYDVVVNGATICAATTALQCTFNSVVLGTKYDVQVKVTNDGLSKTGVSSYQTFADTMKTLQIISYTTSSVTFSYSSTYGVQGVTTFAFTINGAAATCNDFAQCTVSGFTPSNPGVQLTIVGKSINYGNSSPTKTITQQLYPVVSVPTFTLSNTPVSISISFASTGGVPSPATTYQVLLNDVSQTCTTSPCTLSGLTTLSTYSVQVKAINDGTTTSSLIQTVKLWDLLTAPTLSVAMLTKSSSLTFSAKGGNPALTLYSISVNNVPYAPCQSIASTTCNVASLTPSTSYTFAVFATNAGLNLSKSIVAPTYSQISEGIFSSSLVTTKLISLNFTVNGGVPSATKYTVNNNGVDVIGCIDISSNTCTLSGLTHTTNYNIQVTAVNDGKSLSFSKKLTTYTKVSNPTLTLIGKPTSIFTRYSSTFGVPSPSTIYHVLLDGVVYSQCTGTATTCTITGLTTLSEYSVQVTATNDGDITQSPVQNVTLWDLMSEPILTATALTKSIHLNYEAPGGDPLQTSFVVIMNSTTINQAGNSVCQESKPDANGECFLTDLLPGTTYSFIVTSNNVDRHLSSELIVETYAELSNLLLDLVYITTKEISLKYSVENGIPELTYFNVSLNGQPTSCIKTQETSCVISDLVPGSSQEISIIAVSDQTQLTLSRSYQTYSEISNPSIQISQTSTENFDITYSTVNGVPSSTTYDVLVNEAVICPNTTQLSCIYDDLELGSLYQVKVIAYNDDMSKMEIGSIQTYSEPTGLNLSADASVSSIYVSWNASENGQPNETTYSTIISYNSQNWTTICSKSKQLYCDITKLAPKTRYIIKVIVYNSYYQPVEQSVSISTISALDDSSCKKNETAPVCSENGECLEGVCQCKEGWSGIYCQIDGKDNHNGNDTITPNPQIPEIEVENNGISYKFEVFSITEITDTGDQVKYFNVSEAKWMLESSSNQNISHAITGEIIALKQWSYSANSTSLKYAESMEISFIQYQAPKNSALLAKTIPVSFAGKDFQINIGSHKFTMRVEKWPFQSRLNNLVFSMRVTNPVGVKDQCGNLKAPSSNDTIVLSTSEVTSFNIGDGNGNYIVGSMLNTLIVDTIPMVAVHTYIQREGHVEIDTVVPQFEEFAMVDPDFGLILAPNAQTDNRNTCNPTTKKDDNWRVIVGSVVGGTVGVALVAGSALLIRKRRIADKYNKKVERSTQKA